MKKDSEYLFGKPASHYEPHQSQLAKMKIADATEVMHKMVEKRIKGFANEDEMNDCMMRYLDAEKARNWWRDIR